MAAIVGIDPHKRVLSAVEGMTNRGRLLVAQRRV